MVRLAAFCIVLVVLYLGRPIVIPILLATLIAISLTRIVHITERFLPRWVGVSLAVFSAIALVSGLGVLITRAASQFAASFPEYRDHWLVLQGDLVAWLQSQNLEIPATAVEGFEPHKMAFNLALPGLTVALTIVTTGFLVLLITVFFVLEGAGIEAKLKDAETLGPMDLAALKRASRDVQQYLWIKTVTSSITGVLIGLMINAIGLGNALLFGLLAFALNYIPNIGSILAGIPAVALCMMKFGLLPATGLAVGYFVINMTIGVGVEPRWAGRATDLSPAVIILSMVFWGFVLGPIGALVSVPLTIIFRIAASQSPEWEWLAMLLRSPRAAVKEDRLAEGS